MSEAIDASQSLYPGLLDQNPNLFFQLKCRQFIEMVNGCDGEVKPLAHSPTRSTRNSPCASPARSLSHTNSTGSSCSGGSSSGSHNAIRNGDSMTDSTESINELNGIENGSEDCMMRSVDEFASNGVCKEEDCDSMDHNMDISDDFRPTSTGVSVITSTARGLFHS